MVRCSIRVQRKIKHDLRDAAVIDKWVIPTKVPETAAKVDRGQSGDLQHLSVVSGRFTETTDSKKSLFKVSVLPTPDCFRNLGWRGYRMIMQCNIAEPLSLSQLLSPLTFFQYALCYIFHLNVCKTEHPDHGAKMVIGVLVIGEVMVHGILHEAHGRLGFRFRFLAGHISLFPSPVLPLL